MNTCKMDNQGRIVIPSSWRAKQGIKPGAELFVREGDDGRLSVETLQQSVRRAQEMVRALVPPGVSLVDDLFRERRREVAMAEREMRRYLKPNGKRSR